MSVRYCYVRDSRMYRLVPTWKGMILREGRKKKELASTLNPLRSGLVPFLFRVNESYP